MGKAAVMYDGPCTDCGRELADMHRPGCKYAAEGRVGISGHAALRRVPPTEQRTVDDKIARLRARLKQMPMDANVRAILLGMLDLLGDEL